MRKPVIGRVISADYAPNYIRRGPEQGDIIAEQEPYIVGDKFYFPASHMKLSTRAPIIDGVRQQANTAILSFDTALPVMGLAGICYALNEQSCREVGQALIAIADKFAANATAQAEAALEKARAKKGGAA